MWGQGDNGNTVSTLGLSSQSVVFDCRDAGSGSEEHGNLDPAYTEYIDAVNCDTPRQHHSQDILTGQQITWARDRQYTAWWLHSTTLH